MGRVCNGPRVLWAEFAMGRDVPEPNKRVFPYKGSGLISQKIDSWSNVALVYRPKSPLANFCQFLVFVRVIAVRKFKIICSAWWSG